MKNNWIASHYFAKNFYDVFESDTGSVPKSPILTSIIFID